MMKMLKRIKSAFYKTILALKFVQVGQIIMTLTIIFKK